MIPENLQQVYQDYLSVKKTFERKILEKTPAQRQFSPEPTAWNMLQVWEHILLSEQGILSFLQKYPPAESKHKITEKNKTSYAALKQYFASGAKAQAPVEALHPQGGQKVEELQRISASCSDGLRAELERFPSSKMGYSVFKHPVAGGLSMEDTVDFFAIHIEHHTRQLDRIEKAAGYPTDS